MCDMTREVPKVPSVVVLSCTSTRRGLDNLVTKRPPSLQNTVIAVINKALMLLWPY